VARAHELASRYGERFPPPALLLNTAAEGAPSAVEPALYQVATDGSCGKLIAAAGWHAWRPAHRHLKVSAPGHQTLTTQLDR